MAQCPPNTLLQRRFRLGACEWIISYFKGGKHFYKRRSVYCVYARKKLEFIKQSPNEFYEVKCMIRIYDVCCNNKEEVWGAKPPRRWYDNTNFNPPPLT